MTGIYGFRASATFEAPLTADAREDLRFHMDDTCGQNFAWTGAVSSDGRTAHFAIETIDGILTMYSGVLERNGSQWLDAYPQGALDPHAKVIANLVLSVCGLAAERQGIAGPSILEPLIALGELDEPLLIEM